MNVQKIDIIPCPYCARVQHVFSEEEKKSLERGEGMIKCDFCKKEFNLKLIYDMMK